MFYYEFEGFLISILVTYTGPAADFFYIEVQSSALRLIFCLTNLLNGSLVDKVEIY